MTGPKQPPIASHPRWDGRRVLFELADGDRDVACTISTNALQDLSGQRRFKPVELLACFATARARIEAIALGKIRARAQEASGLLNIWSNDVEPDEVDDQPATSEPAAARPAKARRVT